MVQTFLTNKLALQNPKIIRGFYDPINGNNAFFVAFRNKKIIIIIKIRNGTAQTMKKCNTEMERSGTIEKLGHGNETV